MDPKDNRTFKLRRKTVEELLTTLQEHRKELSNLRVNKVASGLATKLAKLRSVRKTIARVLTVINQKRREDLKVAFSSRAGIVAYNKANGTTFSTSKLPKEMRNRLTRNLRRKITKRQAQKLLPKQQKRLNAFPQRKFALKA